MKYVLLSLLCGVIFWGCSTNTVVTYRTLAVTENPVGEKIGQINQTQGGILEAARNGGITSISTVSKQATDKYVTYFWPMLLGVRPFTVNTEHKEEIIVSGD